MSLLYWSDFWGSLHASIYGIPCKVDVDGSQVEKLYNSNKIDNIRNYCEQDVLCTYLLYLKYASHTGRVTNNGYNNCIVD